MALNHKKVEFKLNAIAEVDDYKRKTRLMYNLEEDFQCSKTVMQQQTTFIMNQ